MVRLSRLVHGVGEGHGFVSMLAAVASKKGLSAYVGDGGNQWPALHQLNAARLFRLPLERGGRNEAFHAAENVPYKLLAKAIGRQVGVPATSLTPEEAETHFADLAVWVAGSGAASSERSKAVLGGGPREIGRIADTNRPDYCA